jgi:hypothetical protein
MDLVCAANLLVLLWLRQNPRFGVERGGLDSVFWGNDQPGFKDHPEGFQVCLRTLDEDSWAEGFAKGLARDKRSSKTRSCRKAGWSQWVDATLSSDPHSMKTKAKALARVRSAGTLPG